MYPKRKVMKEMMSMIENLLDTRPDEIPKESQFLLDFDNGKLARLHIHGKTCWVVATEAALIAGQRIAATGARLGRMHNMSQMHMTRRAQLGIPAAEEQNCLDRFTYGSNNGEQQTGTFCSQAATKSLSRRQGYSSIAMTANLRSSK